MQTSKSDPIYQSFRSTADERGSHTAVIYLGSRFSYRWLAEKAERLAAALVDLNAGNGRKVMLYIPNSIQWIVAWLGIMKAGGVSVPITPIYTPNDLKYIATDCAAETIICADTNYGYVRKVFDDTPLQRAVIVKMADLLPWWKRGFGYLFDVVPRGAVNYAPDVYSFRNLIRSYQPRTDDEQPATAEGSHPAEILYTGGTTKFPKGVPISHALFLASALEQIQVSTPLFSAQDNVIMGNAPLFHILGQTCSLATLLVGGTLLVQPRINLDATFDAIQRFRARTMIGVPTLYRMILEHERLEQYDLSSVDYWYSAGDVLPVEVGNRWKDIFGKPIYQGYGATETCGGVSMCPTDGESPPRSVGRIVPSKAVRIVDPVSLDPVETGEPGELLVSSSHMVSAYLNKPEETRSSFIEKDGRLWYRTADIMRMDNEGHLYFVDRTIDTIKHKGYRVSASEIESVIQEHPAVISACVVGLPDEKVGQRIKAFVVLKSDIKGITGYDLIKWCRNMLASYKIPQYIEFRDMLPKSKVGKLLRREIRDEEQRRKEA
jgi:long-chain acyl-CoA synthetase